jgi:crotonobetainyl-CoA:carnitine CoA-transferase CaiB-like acyl-CoA transferase
MQAEAGLMSLTGEPEGPPSRFGPSIIDYMTGMTAMVGLLSALVGARRSGRGCDVDTCLFDVALHQLNYTATWYLNEGKVSARQPRSAHFSVAPVQTFPTRNGWVFVMCMTDKFWQALAHGLGRAELLQDPRFANQQARHTNLETLTRSLDAEFRTHSTEHWVEKFSQLLPIGPVYDLPQALENPFVQATGMINTVAHPLRPELKVLANPIKINGQRLRQQAGPAVGADNQALLGQPVAADTPHSPGISG